MPPIVCIACSIAVERRLRGDQLGDVGVGAVGLALVELRRGLVVHQPRALELGSACASGNCTALVGADRLAAEHLAVLRVVDGEPDRQPAAPTRPAVVTMRSVLSTSSSSVQPPSSVPTRSLAVELRRRRRRPSTTTACWCRASRSASTRCPSRLVSTRNIERPRACASPCLDLRSCARPPGSCAARDAGDPDLAAVQAPAVAVGSAAKLRISSVLEPASGSVSAMQKLIVAGDDLRQQRRASGRRCRSARSTRRRRSG